MTDGLIYHLIYPIFQFSQSVDDMTRPELLKKYHQVTAHLNKTKKQGQGLGGSSADNGHTNGPGVSQSAWEYPHYHSNFNANANAKRDSQEAAASSRTGNGNGGKGPEKNKETAREAGNAPAPHTTSSNTSHNTPCTVTPSLTHHYQPSYYYFFTHLPFDRQSRERTMWW